MSSVSAIALSGMRSAQAQLQASAAGIAGAAMGRPASPAAPDTAVDGRASTTTSQAFEPGDSLATDMVGLLQGKNAFFANLAVFRTTDRMVGSLLDALG